MNNATTLPATCSGRGNTILYVQPQGIYIMYYMPIYGAEQRYLECTWYVQPDAIPKEGCMGMRLSTHLYPHEVDCQFPLMGGANELEDEVDDGQVVHSDLVLLGTHIGFHGDQSEHAQCVQQGLAERSHLRGMELGVAHVQQARGTVEPGGSVTKGESHILDLESYYFVLAKQSDVCKSCQK